jgi:hypothetical protein
MLASFRVRPNCGVARCDFFEVIVEVWRETHMEYTWVGLTSVGTCKTNPHGFHADPRWVLAG